MSTEDAPLFVRPTALEANSALPSKNLLVKLALIGDSGVGKSSLLARFASPDEYSDTHVTTLGVDFRLRTVQVGDKCVKLHMWDTGGQERFRAITPAYYRSVDGIILVYDVTDSRTFDHTSQWLADVERYAENSPHIMLVGNKADLESQREVTEQAAQAFADEHKLTFIETSAKTSTNVEAAFLLLTQDILRGSKQLGTEPGPARPKPQPGCCN